MSHPPPFDARQIQSLLDLGADRSIVRELVDLLEADVPGRLESLAAALAEGDTGRAVEEAHHLKGALGNMGLLLGSDLARQIEEGCRRRRLPEAAAPAAELPAAYREGLRALKAAFPA